MLVDRPNATLEVSMRSTRRRAHPRDRGLSCCGPIITSLPARVVALFCCRVGALSVGVSDEFVDERSRTRLQDGASLVQAQLRFQNASSEIRPKVLISSFGGVGTSSFMRELSKLDPPLAINDVRNRDGLKHLPYDRLVVEHAADMDSIERILYIYGDPSHAVLSHYRRGFAKEQANETRSEPMKWKFPPTVERYASTRYDAFQFQRHFDSFLQQCDRPIAFLRIAEKTDHVDGLAAFLSVDRSELQKALVPFEYASMAELSVERDLRPREAFDDDHLAIRVAELSHKIRSQGLVTRLGEARAPHDYADVLPATKKMIRSKFARLSKQMGSLPGFYIPEPTGDCRRSRPL